jgi:hypothetical protein
MTVVAPEIFVGPFFVELNAQLVDVMIIELTFHHLPELDAHLQLRIPSTVPGLQTITTTRRPDDGFPLRSIDVDMDRAVI